MFNKTFGKVIAIRFQNQNGKNNKMMKLDTKSNIDIVNKNAKFTSYKRFYRVEGLSRRSLKVVEETGDHIFMVISCK